MGWARVTSTRRGFASCALCALSGFATTAVEAEIPPGGTKRKILPRIDGPTRDFEIMIALAEIEPGFHAPRHIHPGNESANIVAGVAARTPHLLQNGAKPTRIVSTCIL